MSGNGPVVRARALFVREPALTAIGVAGLLVSLVCLVGVGVHGALIPPEGKMPDAVTFTLVWRSSR